MRFTDGWKTQLELRKRNFRKIRKAIESSENNIIFQMVSVKDIPLNLANGCKNQIVIMYKTNRMEILPVGVDGTKIKDYLGVRYNRITHWSVLSMPSNMLRSELSDIYAS